MFFVVSFHTEGHPHDAGKNLILAERKFRERIEPLCYSYISHTPRSLSSVLMNDDDFFGDHSGSLKEVKFNSEWSRLGFMRWKPLLLAHVMTEIPEGAIVMYHDVDCLKYPQYLLGVEDWGSISGLILSELRSDIMMPYENHLLRVGCKKFLLDKYGMDGNRPSLWSGVFIFRNSPCSFRFASDWLEMSSIENSSPLPDGDNPDDFFWHSPDQSVATVTSELWKRDGLLDRNWPRFSFRDRIISRETILEFS